ncbi:MAG: hypothetical protein WD492_14575 [Alkalispirochaeta sp.]
MHAGLVRASRLIDPHREAPIAGAETLLHDAAETLSGSIIQLSGTAPLTVATQLMVRFQQLSAAPVAWVGDERSMPFPIDLLHSGIELARVCVVRAADMEHRLYVVDRLLRARITSLIVLDHGEDEAPTPGVLGRFMHLCRHSGATVVVLTPGDVRALSPAVRLHLRVSLPQIDTTLSSPVRLEVLRSRMPLQRGSIDVVRPAGMC